MIQPIETEYNGYRFRSRLEARWAVFFDTLGIEYRYEPEGFEFEDGTRYLPDFWLPDAGIWIEIKATKATQDELKLAHKLRGATKAPVLVVQGQPYCEDYYTSPNHPKYTIDYFDNEFPEFDYPEDGSCYLFGECRYCPALGLIMESDKMGNNTIWAMVLGPCERLECLAGKRPPLMTERVEDVLIAARSARFEFGETPRPRRRRRRRR